MTHWHISIINCIEADAKRPIELKYGTFSNRQARDQLWTKSKPNCMELISSAHCIQEYNFASSAWSFTVTEEPIKNQEHH